MVGDSGDGRETELTLLSREELEAVVRERRDALKNVMDAMVDVLVKLDRDGRIQLANEAVTSILGYDRETVVGKPVDILLAPDEAIGEGFELVSAEEFLSLLVAERKVTDLEVALSTVDDEVVPASLSTAVLEGDEGVEGFVCVAKDISERKAAERALRDRTLQLAVLNQALRHDIRNDMAALLARARQLDGQLEGQEADDLDVMLTAGERVVELTETVGNLVDVIEEDGQPDLIPVPIEPVLEEELSAFREKFPDARVSIDGDIPYARIRANDMLTSVLQNVFTNAVRHNDEDSPEVTVRVTDRDDAIRLAVADNGPGVPDARKEAIFGKGEQGLESTGTGLGLYLVHTVLKQYGGDVWVEDNDPKGAVFVLKLPKYSDGLDGDDAGSPFE